MNGLEAIAAFKKADALFKAGEYEAALSVEMMPSDRTLIEKRIAELNASGANSTKEDK